MKKISLISLVFALLVGFSASAYAGEPQNRLKTGIDKVISILSDHALKAPSKRHERESRLRSVANGFFDWRELSRRTLGRNWNRYTAAQQKDFVASFSELLEKTYIRKLEKYTNERVIYQREQVEGDHAFINTEVVSRDKKIPINYVMIKRGQWMVYDVVIEGVSLVKNYRSQFQKILSRESPDMLLRRIHAKIKALDSGKNVDDVVGRER